MKNHAGILNDCEAPRSVSVKRMCERDINYAVGDFFIVRTCGHIETFRPLFQYVK